MGLFTAECGYQEEDYAETLKIATFIANWWNAELAEYHGFKLFVSAESVEECCKSASRIFSSEGTAFADFPSAYKRIGAYLVMGCLEPFWGFQPFGRPAAWGIEQMPTTDTDRRRWHVRFLIQSLHFLINRFQIEIGGSWKSIHWHGFPSSHYQLEFMNWMRWLDGLDNLQTQLLDNEWQTLQDNRIARMVMATALMIESCCYCDPKQPANHCGQVGSCLAKLTESDRLDLDFMRIPGN